MTKPIKKPSPNPKNPIVSRESIEILIFFMNRFAKNDHKAREPGKRGHGGEWGFGDKAIPPHIFHQKPPKTTKNHQSHTKVTPKTLKLTLES